jgi:hypothetical protein
MKQLTSCGFCTFNNTPTYFTENCDLISESVEKYVEVEDCRAGVTERSKKSKKHRKSKRRANPQTLGLVAHNLGAFITELGKQLSQIDIQSSKEESEESDEEGHSHHHHSHKHKKKKNHHSHHHHEHTEPKRNLHGEDLEAEERPERKHKHKSSKKKKKQRHHKNHVHHTHHKEDHGKKHVHHTHHKRGEEASEEVKLVESPEPENKSRSLSKSVSRTESSHSDYDTPRRAHIRLSELSHHLGGSDEDEPDPDSDFESYESADSGRELKVLGFED